jgi:hypothetical protein
MKNVMSFFAGLMFIVFGAMSVVSCDPCSGVVCNNGTCSNGTCVCEGNYIRNGSSCYGLHVEWVDTSSTANVIATQLRVDSNGVQTTTTNLGLSLMISTTDPLKFTLKNFNTFVGNDITFTVNESNHELLVMETVIASINNTYTISGSRTGSQIQLVIKDIANTTYTLSYSI